MQDTLELDLSGIFRRESELLKEDLTGFAITRVGPSL